MSDADRARARKLMAEGRASEAIEIYERLTGEDPVDMTFVSYGRALRDAGRYEEASAVFRGAIQRPRQRGDITVSGTFEYELARVLEASGHLGEAMDQLAAAVAKHPGLRGDAWRDFTRLAAQEGFRDLCGALPEDPELRQLYTLLEDDPYGALVLARDLSTRCPDELGVRHAQHQAIVSLASNLDEHGPMEDDGGVTMEGLTRERTEVESRITALEQAGATSRAWHDYALMRSPD